jgi:hypothetical protein
LHAVVLVLALALVALALALAPLALASPGQHRCAVELRWASELLQPELTVLTSADMLLIRLAGKT